jgi:2-oxoglutarate-Fe(II)-dependent oxygenase superfamily protein
MIPDPFPHIIIEDFLPTNHAERLADFFPSMDNPGWQYIRHVNEQKYTLSDRKYISPILHWILDWFNSKEFKDRLTRITGIPNLISSPLPGGGLYMTKRGGFLNIHADATAHPYHKNWRRRLNLLIYLNKVWDPAWGGALELWDADMARCVKKVDPIHNRAVIFECGPTSYHGHPHPLMCPEDTARRLIALYYFTEEKQVAYRETFYRPLPEDSKSKRFLMGLDQWALKVLAWARRILRVKF